MSLKYFPDGLTQKERFEYAVKNEAYIISAKKMERKLADSAAYGTFFVDEKGKLVDKAEAIQQSITTDPNKLKLSVVINTTNWLDSHWDVHLPGIWKKCIADNKKGFLLLQEHNAKFKGVIATGMQAKTVKMPFKDLGFDYEGNTEALVFTGIIDKDRNEYMFNQYLKKYVEEHSVGMRYIKMVTCINDEEYPVQLENWNKYFPMVTNQDDALKCGMFWAVLEAEIKEGSAVLFGSNCVTPTLDIEEITDGEPDKATQNQPKEKTFMELIKETKFI